MRFDFQDLVAEFADNLRCLFLKILSSSVYGKNSVGLPDGAAKKKRKPRVKLFCLVPHCKGVAAPIFGMVCRDHKGLSKAKIAIYRKARIKARIEAKQGIKPRQPPVHVKAKKQLRQPTVSIKAKKEVRQPSVPVKAKKEVRQPSVPTKVKKEVRQPSVPIKVKKEARQVSTRQVETRQPENMTVET